MTFYPGGPFIVKAEPARADCCPTCGAPVVVVSEDEGTAHYIPMWDTEAVERLLKAIQEEELGEELPFAEPFLDKTLPEEVATKQADEQENAIYSALADLFLCPGDAEHRASFRRLQRRLNRLARTLSPQVKGRVAGKIASALQAIPGLSVAPSGRIWPIKGTGAEDDWTSMWGGQFINHEVTRCQH